MKKSAFILGAMLLAASGCATDGATSVGVGFYGDWGYYDDVWYGGGCCVNVPEGGGPRPEHPIALPPDGIGPPRVENPIVLPDAQPKAKASSTTSSSSANRTAAPRMSSMPRGGGGRGGGRR